MADDTTVHLLAVHNDYVPLSERAGADSSVIEPERSSKREEDQIRVAKRGGLLILASLPTGLLGWVAQNYGDKGFFWALAIALVLFGLAIITSADMDMNLTLKPRKWMPICFHLLLVIFSCMSAWTLFPVWIIFGLPSMFFILRFRQMLDMEPGFPLFTDTLMWVAVAYHASATLANVPVIVGLVTDSIIKPPQWWPGTFYNPHIFDNPSVPLYIGQTLCYLVGVFCVPLAYQASKARGDKPCVQGYMSLYAFLVADGSGYGVQGFIQQPEFSRKTPALWGRAALELLVGVFMINFRQRFFGILARRWARQRMVDGAQVSVLLERVRYSVGMDYWLHRPDLCDDPDCTEIRCAHPTCNQSHTECACQMAPDAPPPNDKWVKAQVVSVVKGGDGGKIVTVQASDLHKKHVHDHGETASVVNITKIITAKSVSSATDILKEGIAQLQCVQAGKITYAKLAAGSGKSNIDELAEDGIPGEVDYFISHSWHDDKETKFREWERFFAARKRRQGKDAKVWLDEIIINQVRSCTAASSVESSHCRHDCTAASS
jgi:hypothetical protein